MTVMMPVRCIGDICKQCDKLNLEVNRYYYGTDGGKYYYGTDVGTVNDICCANVQTCELIKQMVENETNKEDAENDR